VLRAAGETETTQENIQDWLELDGDLGFQLPTTKKKNAAVIVFIYFFISTAYIIKFSIYLCSKFFFLAF
jgi:short-subunit dehydrogenase